MLKFKVALVINMNSCDKRGGHGYNDWKYRIHWNIKWYVIYDLKRFILAYIPFETGCPDSFALKNDWSLMALIIKNTYGCKICKFCCLSFLLAGCEFLGFTSNDPVKVVLEDDGTIVEDEAYFLCLPSNTKFMLLHEKETWSPVRRSKKVCLYLRFVYSLILIT